MHFVPVRKSLDLIDEASSLAGEPLRLSISEYPVRVFGESADPAREGDAFALPNVKGRLLIKVIGYFSGQ
jgi:hypothetical protein